VIESLLRELDALLAPADEQAARFAGDTGLRQPLHTVYVPADRYRRDLPARYGASALRLLEEHAPDAAAFEAATGVDGDVLERVRQKLATQPIEDLRVDFEDGYGLRPDAEEDAAARSVGEALARAATDPGAPLVCGVRVKSLERRTRRRAVRTLTLVVDGLASGRSQAANGEAAPEGAGATEAGVAGVGATEAGAAGGGPTEAGAASTVGAGLGPAMAGAAAAGALSAGVGLTDVPGAGVGLTDVPGAGVGLTDVPTGDAGVPAHAEGSGLPPRFVVVLPKVTHPAEVTALVALCEALETAHGLPAGWLRFELQVEVPQAVVGPDGAATVARLVHASAGRCEGLHYGTYDFSAAAGVAAGEQALDHPLADHAKAVMQLAAAGTGVRVSDGSTNVVPTGDTAAVHAAWRLHARLVDRALRRGLYQGWDLHPGQLPTRYAASYAFLRAELAASGDRLRAYVSRAATGVLDEPATAQALATAVLRAVECGACDDAEALAVTGLDRAALGRLVRREA
jgi:citrate lyase beta subunit